MGDAPIAWSVNFWTGAQVRWRHGRAFGCSLIGRLFLIVVVAGALFSGSAMALDAGRTIRQFQHTAWTMHDGMPAAVWAMAQSPDGYLWLGTGFGLYRFDGVSFERIRGAAGRDLGGIDITALAALPTGELWIGYQSGGVSRLVNGRLVNFTVRDGLPSGAAVGFAKDRNNDLWAGVEDGIAWFDGRQWHNAAADRGFPANPDTVRDIAVARDGTLWVETQSALFFLRSGTHRFERWGPEAVRMALPRDKDGRIWRSDADGHLSLLTDETDAHEMPADKLSRSQQGLFDRDGTFWRVDRQRDGLLRLHAPAGGQTSVSADTFAIRDGLSSSIATALLEDREGNIWVGTNLGLDRFRAANVVMDTTIPVTSPDGYSATRAGQTLYIAGGSSLFAIQKGAAPQPVAHDIPGLDLLYTTADGTTWSGGKAGLARLSNGVFIPVPLPPAIDAKGVCAMAQMRDGALLVSLCERGLFSLMHGVWAPFEVRPGHSGTWPRLMQTDSQGRIWLSYHDGGLLRLDGDQRQIYSQADGPDIGEIQVIVPDGDGVIMGGVFGIARFDGRRFHTLHAAQYEPLTLTSGIIATPQGETWINSQVGVVHISSRALARAFEHPGSHLDYALLDFRDGLTGVAQQDSFQNTALLGPDARLWFITGHGVAWVDPTHLTRNPLPPPVFIAGLATPDRSYNFPANLTLAEGTSNLRIDYTALSLSDPQRVRFRYRLDGIDLDWIDPGERRQAFYTKLSPGDYRFRVIAANNDGVWNSTGATLTFVIPPAFVETKWFVLLCGLAGAALLWLLYSLRLRQVAARIRAGLEARLAERERIARELHDTLLQGFQGLMLRFQAAADHMPVDQPGRLLLEGALERADKVLVEGRERVHSLRVGDGDGDLAQVFAAAADGLSLDASIAFKVTVEGKARPLHPIVRDEVTKIGNEAIINAAQHARPAHIGVDIVYGGRALCLRISDDGVGIDPAILKSGNRQGHFGLTGMRERARKIQAVIALASRVGAGTELELTVPAGVAYAATPRRLFGWRFRSAPAQGS